MRTRIWATALAASVAAGMVVTAVDAQAQQTRRSSEPQNLFEVLFPDIRRQRLEREGFRLDNQQQQQQAAPIVKIEAPKYYTYKADSLVRIKLAAIARKDVVVTGATPAATQLGESSGNGVTVEVYGPSLKPTVVQTDPVEDAYYRVAALLGTVSVMAEADVAKVLQKHFANATRLMWLDENLKPSARARTVLPLLANAAEYGLVAEDYAVALPVEGDDADAARFEVEMTARAMRYGLDAANGLILPNRIGEYYDFPSRKVTAEAVLEQILTGGLTVSVLQQFHPRNRQFAALRTELARLSGLKDDSIELPTDVLIKPGMTHADLKAFIAAMQKKGSDVLRTEHLTVFTEAAVADKDVPLEYTPERVALVKAYQKEAGLSADGIIGRGTASKLTDVSLASKRERVRIAMEQLRWHPEELGSRHVFINQPAFKARFVNGGETRIEMRVVVGTPANQTYFFHDMIETVEYNPYWGVPQSILVNEYLPKLRANPAYLDERGYEVTDASGRAIPSAAINWHAFGGKVPYNVRQSPGEANALGELKILFPNKHAIYMHDTPAKSLFSKDVRAYSHGCVRLADPRAMAAAVLGKDIAHVETRLGEGHGSDDVTIRTPVYVAYFTAWPKDDGTVEYFGDIYGRDVKTRQAMEITRKAREATS